MSTSGGFADRLRVTATSSTATGATPRASRSRATVTTRSIFDLGTGLRNYGEHARRRGPRSTGTTPRVLLTHLHWDHIQGLPFFAPLAAGGGTVDVYGPHQEEGPLDDVFRQRDEPAVLPDHARGAARRRSPSKRVGHDDFAVNGAKVRSRWVRHTDPTLGFRVEMEGVSVAYLSDHGPGTVARRRRRLRARTTCSSSATASTCSSTTRSTPPTSTRSSATGVTARSSTRSTSPRKRARGSSRCSTTARRTATTSLDDDPARRARARRHGSAAPRCSRRPTACSHELRPR